MSLRDSHFACRNTSPTRPAGVIQQAKSHSRSDINYSSETPRWLWGTFPTCLLRASDVPVTRRSEPPALWLECRRKEWPQETQKSKKGGDSFFAFFEFLAASTLRPRRLKLLRLKLLHRAALALLHGDFMNLPPLRGTSDFGEIADNQPAR